MWPDGGLTNCIRKIGWTLVQEHLPEEADYFDDLWDGYWQLVGVSRIEDLTTSLSWRPTDKGIVNLGVFGGGEVQLLEASRLTEVMTATTLSLLFDERNALLTIEDIARSLAIEAKRIDAPSRICTILQSSGTKMLADLFLAVDQLPERRYGQGEDDSTIRLWVEWREDLRKGFVYEPPERESFEIPQVQEKFGENMNKYQLYIDETSGGVVLHGKKGGFSCVVDWFKFEQPHLVLLGMMIEAFRTQDWITHDKFGWRNKMATSTAGDEKTLRTHIHNTKYELNNKLKGLVKKTVRALRRERAYAVEKPITYCWIHQQDVESRLFI